MDAKEFLRMALKKLEADEMFFDWDKLPTGRADEPMTIICTQVDAAADHVAVVDGRLEYPAACGHAVWVSPHSQAKLKQYPQTRLMCTECMYQEWANDDAAKGGYLSTRAMIMILTLLGAAIAGVALPLGWAMLVGFVLGYSGSWLGRRYG